MVYKKYIKKDGKNFGPYLYESYRNDDGKVKTRFVGPAGQKAEEFSVPKTHSFIYFLIFAGIFLLSLSAGFYYLNVTDNNLVSETFSSITAQITNTGYTFYSFISGRAIDESAPVESAPAPTETPVSSDTSQPITPTTEIISETPTSEISAETPIIEVPTDNPEQLPISENVIIEPPAPPVIEVPVLEENQSTSEATNETSVLEEIIGVNIGVAEQVIIGLENATETILGGSSVTESIIEPEIIINETEIVAVNETIVEENISANINTQITTKQYSAIIGKPVKWQKMVKIEKTELPEETTTANIQLELPSNAGDVSITKIESATGNSEDITQQATIENEKDIAEIQPATITGNVVIDSSESENGLITKISTFFSEIFNSFLSITGNIVDENLDIPVTISVNEQVANNDEVVVEYYTDAPYAEETLIDNSKKEVIIVGPDAVHYQDVLAYSELPAEVKDASKIKLYWTSSDSGEKEIVSFDAEDYDGNGLIDTIEWLVPHLSNQTYEIIVITKAVHLDANRNEISDIYDFVKTQDNNWSEIIPSGDYVRVTFEQMLDNTKDITIYARSVSGTSLIDVYTEGGTEIVATISDISAEGTYRTLLTSLPDNVSYDVFDLKVVGGNVEFDYIVDPQYPGADYAVIGDGDSSLGSPNGNYIATGNTLNGQPTYIRVTSPALYIWYDAPISGWHISDGLGIGTNAEWYSVDETVLGTYPMHTIPGVSGTPEVISGGGYYGYTIFECGNITQNGTYTFNQSISVAWSGACFNITSDNVVIDGNGFSMGTPANGFTYAFYALNRTNITIKNFNSIVSVQYGVYFARVLNSKIINNTFSSIYSRDGTNPSAGIYLSATNNTLVDSNTISPTEVISTQENAITIREDSANNVLLNNIINAATNPGIYHGKPELISTQGGYNNSLIYNNSFGEIKWLNNNFLSNLTTSGSLTFPGNIIIANNSAYFNSAAFAGQAINSSANITLRNVGDRGYILPAILKDGAVCNDTIAQPCHNFTALNASIVIFNVSSWSNYSIGEGFNWSLSACGVLDKANGNYYLQNDISATGNCFTIGANNVSLNLNGYIVDGDDVGGDIGLYNNGWNFTYISNGIFTDFQQGLFYYDSSNVTIKNIISNSSVDGIYFTGHLPVVSMNNRLENVTIKGNTAIGLNIQRSSNNRYDNITSAYNGAEGIYGNSASLNNVFTNIVSTNNGGDGFGAYGNLGIILSNFTSNNNGDDGIYLESDGTILREIVANSNVRGLRIYSGITEVTIYNFNAQGNSDKALYMGGSSSATLTINNSNGEIVWLDSGFSSNLTIDDDFVLGSTINITNGSVVISSSLLSANPLMNTTINITFRNPGYYYQYPVLLHKMKVGNSRCSDCYNFSALTNPVVVINTSSFGDGTISLGKSVVSQSNVSLSSGWNMISLEMQNGNSGTQRNVTIYPGWNLIGYSSENNLSHSAVRFVNSTESMTIVQASARGYIQKYFGYLADNGSAKRYNYVPKEDLALTKQKGYWIYANTGVNGNLTLDGVGGSPQNETYRLSDLMFRNSTGVELNVTDAFEEAWIAGTDVNNIVYYWDFESEDWSNTLSTQSFSSWQGYFINSLKSNLTLFRQN